jgi:hypothetical protein
VPPLAATAAVNEPLGLDELCNDLERLKRIFAKGNGSATQQTTCHPVPSHDLIA